MVRRIRTTKSGENERKLKEAVKVNKAFVKKLIELAKDYHGIGVLERSGSKYQESQYDKGYVKRMRNLISKYMDKKQLNSKNLETVKKLSKGTLNENGRNLIRGFKENNKLIEKMEDLYYNYNPIPYDDYETLNSNDNYIYDFLHAIEEYRDENEDYWGKNKWLDEKGKINQNQ